jgi:peptidoglycan/LPS O-acetylase OafA/YrhL
MNTIYAIIGLFALGAIIGMYLLALILQDKETPKAVALIHGGFVVIALVMLIVYITKNSPGPAESLVLFIIAALGGLVVAFRDFTGKKIPKWLAVVHGLVAVAGFIFLLVFAFK